MVKGRKALAAVLLLGTLLVSSHTPAVAGVVFLQQSNEVFAANTCVAGGGTCVSRDSATGVGLYGNSVRYSDTTTGEETSINGGQVNVIEGSITQTAGGSGYALFSLQFEVVGAPEPFDLIANSSNRDGGGDSSVSLTGPAGFFIAETYQGNDQNGVAYYGVNTSGLLAAGTYTLSAAVHTGSANSWTSSNANASLNVVPLPDSLGLLAAGAFLFVMVRGGIGRLFDKHRLRSG